MIGRSGLFFLIFLYLTVQPSYGDERYTISASQQFRLNYQVEVENIRGQAQNLKLRIPIFSVEGLPPYQKLVSFQPPRGVKITKNGDGQIAEYHLARLGKGGNLLLEFGFTFINYAIDYQLNNYQGRNSIESRYVEPEPGIESDAETIVDLARKTTTGCRTQLEKARKLFYYINDTLEYRKIEGDTHSALETLHNGKGVCEDFSLAYVALCRAAGIPARMVRGYRLDASDLSSGTNDLKSFAHAWAEVNLPAEGWVTVEPTFTYSLNGIKTVNYDFFGKIDKSDRHLFFSYLRDIAPSCSWNHDPHAPADLRISFRTLLQK